MIADSKSNRCNKSSFTELESAHSAQAAVSGSGSMHLADSGVGVSLVAHRFGSLLGLRLRAASPTVTLVEIAAAEDIAAIRSSCYPMESNYGADQQLCSHA